MSIESLMLSNHLIVCRPLLLLLSILPSIRVFSNKLTSSHQVATPYLLVLWFSPDTFRPCTGRKAAYSVLLRSNYTCERVSKMLTSPRYSDPEMVYKNETLRPRMKDWRRGGMFFKESKIIDRPNSQKFRR